jgi:hypothetical protein
MPDSFGLNKGGSNRMQEGTQRSFRVSLDSDVLRADDRACLMGFVVFLFPVCQELKMP